MSTRKIIVTGGAGFIGSALVWRLNELGYENIVVVDRQTEQGGVGLEGLDQLEAKTAVELTLGTEQDAASYIDVPLRADDYGLRPRIQAGPTSALRESNSRAAS